MSAFRRFRGLAGMGLKSLVYAKAGIPTYWRIEFADEPTLCVYELNGDT
ncbi:hypothetical protein [Nonomuraea longispora]|nr:hypothetical protein [Nonomuraea longispora]